MASFCNITGNRYGKWTVISFAGFNLRGRALWLCKCDCGKEVVVRGDLLRRGLSESCGCLCRELLSKRKKTHGYCANKKSNGNATYVTWKNMKQRCNDVHADQYHHYGALGIKVCSEWLNDFKQFVKDMGERPEGMTIDRINPFGDYEPSNCRWADWFTQNNNQRRHYSN